jgi:hypothetical protein
VRWRFELLFQLLAPLLLLSLVFQQLLLTTLLQLIFEWLSPPQLWLLLRRPLPWLLLTIFFFLLPPLLDGVEPDGPRRPFHNRRGLHLFIHGTGILREPINTGSIANGNGIPHAPRLGRLRGSLLPLRARRLDPPW